MNLSSQMTATTDKHGTSLERTLGFAEMNLQVGAKLQLSLQRNGKKVKYFTSLIGYVAGEYLLVQVPVENGSPVTLEAGEKLLVKGFSGLRVFSFDCSVKRQFLSRFSYVHLSFPLTVQSTAFRAAVRIRVDIPARVYIPGTDEKERDTPVTLTNLSVEGALIEAKENIGDLQNVIGLSFVFPASIGDQKILIDAKATIRNIKLRKALAPGGTPVLVYGVQFEHLDRTQQARLRNFLYKTQEHKSPEDHLETAS